jgi:pimeloyl-ACP methyl ester carboxylesterase
MSTLESADGTVIAYEKSGEGPPVILVDGALCHRGSGPARPLAKALADRFTVYTYDRRGRGESGDTAPYAVEREIEDLQALVDVACRQGIPPSAGGPGAGGGVAVYGISSGAALALETAVRTPAIEKLALYEAPFVVDDSREPIVLDYAGLSRRQSVRSFLRAVGVPAPFAALLSHMGKLKAVAHTLPYDAEIVGPHQLGNPLPQWHVEADTLVIAGGRSHAWMRNANRALAEATSATYRVLEGQNHMVKANALAPLLKTHFTARHPQQV